jgi:invasion protein IalB
MSDMTERVVVGGVALLVGLGLGWVGHGLSGYSTTTETITNFQDWRTACPAATVKDQGCEIVQDMLDSKTRNEIARIAYVKDNGKPMIAVTLPLGVSLQAGMGISFGTDKAQTAGYRVCNGTGCVAELPVDAKLQASLDAGKDGKLIFAGLDNKPIPIPLSLRGFGDAQRAYRSNEAKRTSWIWRMW